jgi:DNA repair exonuclease SbcCD ATPase subunit
MILHLRDYPPHMYTRLVLPDTGLVIVQGPNESGKSSLVECYAAAMWARTVRGASPWQRETTELRVELPGLVVRRNKHELEVNAASALKPSKKQADLTALVGDFATWQRTRLFDNDLTARFGTSTDGDRKKLVEQLLGFEKLEAGLRRVREDARGAESELTLLQRQVDALKSALDAHPAPVADVDAGRLRELEQRAVHAEEHAAALARQSGADASAVIHAEKALTQLQGGRCPLCGADSRQPAEAYREQAQRARRERSEAEAKLRAARSEVEGVRAELGKLRLAEAEARAARGMAARRAKVNEELLGAGAAAKRQGAAALRRVEEFLLWARPKLFAEALAHLAAAAQVWVPELELRTEGDGLCLLLNEKDYKALNRGHRRLCDLAVLLGLSGFSDAKVKGAIFLDECLDGLDEERCEQVSAMLESAAERELVIVLTHSAEISGRLRGVYVQVLDGKCKFTER